MEDLIFNNWQKAVAPSPHVGFGDMRGVDVDSVTGALRLSKRLQQTSHPTTAAITFTADAGTDILTLASSLNYNVGQSGVSPTGMAVTVSSTGTLPAGLSASTTYFVIDVTSTSCKLATTKANADLGTAINITDAGTGTHSLNVINIGRVRNFAESPAGSFFATDRNGRVWYQLGDIWYLLPGHGTSGAEGNGIAYWKDYLFYFRNNKVDVCYTPTITWTNDWLTLNSGAGSGNSHFAIVGSDDVLYFCDGRYVGSIQENTGTNFDPGNAATFTTNTTALTLPEEYLAQRLHELGKYLEVSASRTNSAGVKLFPWDRTSPSFNIPIKLPLATYETSASDGSWIYVSGGGQGTVYRTNNTTTELFFEFPKYLSGFISGNNLRIDAMTVYENKLFMAVNYSGVSGVWTLNISTKQLVMASGYSLGSYGTTNGISCEAMYSKGNAYYVGWYSPDAGTYAIDSTYAGGYYYNYGYTTAYAESDLRRVGVFYRKKKFTQLEIVLSKPLTTGQGVRVKYRTNLTESYSNALTFDTSISTSLVSYAFPFPGDSSNHIQIKVELTASAFLQTTPEVLEVRLR